MFESLFVSRLKLKNTPLRSSLYIKGNFTLCIFAADVSSIKTFDIEFNLDNVKLLYDYQHGQYLYPTDGKWDYNHLNSSSAFSYLDPKPDKKTKARIKKIDDVITMRNLNLEQKKEMEDTSLWDEGDDGASIQGKGIISFLVIFEFFTLCFLVHEIEFLHSIFYKTILP